MKLTLEETGDGEFLTLPEDTIVIVELAEEPEERDVPGRDGKEGWTKLSFRFRLVSLPTALDSEYGVLVGTTIFGSVGKRFTSHPDNKLRKWAEALLNIGELESGFELDLEMLVGRKARGVIGTYTKKDSTTLNHKIVGLLPLVTDEHEVAQPVFAGFPDDPPF